MAKIMLGFWFSYMRYGDNSEKQGYKNVINGEVGL